MNNDFDFEELDMPTPCQKCGGTFDLNDGIPSSKWFPDTVICENCGSEEEKEIERDEEVEELRETIENAEFDIEQSKKRLVEMGIPFPIPKIL